jgi:hypothetical protein
VFVESFQMLSSNGIPDKFRSVKMNAGLSHLGVFVFNATSLRACWGSPWPTSVSTQYGSCGRFMRPMPFSPLASMMAM